MKLIRYSVILASFHDGKLVSKDPQAFSDVVKSTLGLTYLEGLPRFDGKRHGDWKAVELKERNATITMPNPSTIVVQPTGEVTSLPPKPTK
jgi:hypothetical protein